jgi:hypothetical protein
MENAQTLHVGSFGEGRVTSIPRSPRAALNALKRLKQGGEYQLGPVLFRVSPTVVDGEVEMLISVSGDQFTRFLDPAMPPEESEESDLQLFWCVLCCSPLHSKRRWHRAEQAFFASYEHACVKGNVEWCPAFIEEPPTPWLALIPTSNAFSLSRGIRVSIGTWVPYIAWMFVAEREEASAGFLEED